MAAAKLILLECLIKFFLLGWSRGIGGTKEQNAES